MEKKNTFVVVVIVIVFALLAIGTWLLTSYAEYNTTNNMSEDVSVENMTINSNNTTDSKSVESSQINMSIGDAFNNLWEVGN